MCDVWLWGENQNFSGLSTHTTTKPTTSRYRPVLDMLHVSLTLMNSREAGVKTFSEGIVDHVIIFFSQYLKAETGSMCYTSAADILYYI